MEPYPKRSSSLRRSYTPMETYHTTNKRSRFLKRRNKPMELDTPIYVPWSELPIDILRSVFARLSFIDFHRAKIVSSYWYKCSKQTHPKKNTCPWLILFPQEENGCVLYNPDESRVYKPTKRDFSGFRFLANSDNFFLVLDSESKLYIIDLFSEKKIDLPPLESIKGGRHSLKPIGDKKFEENSRLYSRIRDADKLRGVLWVDESKKEYVVVWFFNIGFSYLAFCKNGKDHYSEISTTTGVLRQLRGLSDIVVKGYTLYMLTTRKYIQILDLSGQEGLKDVSENDGLLMHPSDNIDDKTTCNIAVTRSGEVLLVQTIPNKMAYQRTFRVYKKDPEVNKLVEVDSLGDNETLLLDSGINVPADHTVGLETNSIYFTRLDRIRPNKRFLDICVFNLATKGFEGFPRIADLKLKDARWFLHRT